MDQGTANYGRTVGIDRETRPDTRKRDVKGRLDIEEMTDSEKITESLVIARATQDLVESFLKDFTSGKIGGPLGMFGKMLGKS